MIEDLIQDRLRKLAQLKKEGIDPYPGTARRTHRIGDVRRSFGALAKSKKTVWVTGRIMSLRDQGRLLFADVRDETGTIQGVLKRDVIGNSFSLLKATLDRGDFVEFHGTLFKTKRGELSIEARGARIISKSIRPLPAEWYGIEETETRLRKRYLDVIMDSETKELFRKKNVFWQTFRGFLEKEGFLEMEAPVLEALPGGAEAEPFRTHHNALDVDFYLRISLELPLKKMLVAGYERVFEIGRVFRNEGIDREHLQDYTALEFYWAYSDYNKLMKFTEKMYKAVIKKTTGGLTTPFQGTTIDWSKKWKMVKYVEAFKKFNKLDPRSATRDELFKRAISLGIKPEKGSGKGRLIDVIYKKTVRPTLVAPCFLIDPPVEIEPLAKRSPNDPRVVERMQIVAGGTELGKGFSELNDPLDQRARFEEQMKLRAAGDKEAQFLDEDFLEALEYGMPPAAGFGVSERLFSVLMDRSVRETVFFPLMRPRNE